MNVSSPSVSLTVNTVKKGLTKSASSLSSMINQQVSVEDLNFAGSLSSQGRMWANISSNSYVLILKTELVGPLMGINYVLLTKEEVKAICDHSFGAAMSDESSSQFVIEFLKEIENVMAASAITEIADTLKVDMYGDVPKIQAVMSSKVMDILKTESQSLYPKIHISGKFNVPGLGICPEVIWLFSHSFEEIAVS